jgi:hypothetical protein
MAIADQNSAAFQEVVRTAVSQLVSHTFESGAAYVTTPLIYPSGGCVVVRVEQAADSYVVTDFGAGYEEAQLLNGGDTYRRVAIGVAQSCGVVFDSFSFLVLKVSSSQLSGAIATVANCSHEAVSKTTEKLNEIKALDDNAILYERLSRVFEARYIAKNAEILGASNHAWKVSSLVTLGGKKVAFEPVHKSLMSIASVSLKFGDISATDNAPGTVAVVYQKHELGTHLSLLSRNAKVIEQSAGDQVFHRLLQVA